MPKDKVIVSGILFWYPLAGVTYQFLHYLIGLRQLGFDSYYVEDSQRGIYDPSSDTRSMDAAANVAAVAPILERHGFGERWAFRGAYPGGKCYGMTEERILRLYGEAEALLNVTGAQDLREEHLACRRRIYVESDPFPCQVGVAQGDPATIARLAAHDAHFSFGENLGAPDCLLPADGPFRWLPTRQPVALELWNGSLPAGRGAYTTITTWSNKGKDIDFRGERWYWTKDREFEKFLDLPRRRPVELELATGVTADDARRLHEHGWRHVSPTPISLDVDRYRGYIEGSRAEFTVARDQYVRPRTGWFSDRSACYLAAGRPVITQETGFSKYLPTGRGLFAFETMDDILGAIDCIESDYDAHCRAARDLATDYFAAERVVGSLMERAGLA
jgi:hypothetical protein